MTLEQIQEVCPSAFTVDSAPHLSENYLHIPTSRVIQDMILLGWTPVSAQEVKARKGKGYQKHIIRFQNQSITIQGTNGDDVFPELLLTNSHDGKNSFHLRVGLYRLVCSNGLVVADSEFSNVSIRHMGYSFDELRNQIVALIEALPLLVGKINTFKEKELTQEQALQFALDAAQKRWKGVEVQLEAYDMLLEERPEDAGLDLWSVFNKVQEKLVYGIGNYKKGLKTRKIRAIKNFNADMQFNSELWELAETYLN